MSWFVDKLGPAPRGKAKGPVQPMTAGRNQPQAKSAPASGGAQPQRAAAPAPAPDEKKKKKGWF